jgi:hypothetical protein
MRFLFALLLTLPVWAQTVTPPGGGATPAGGWTDNGTSTSTTRTVKIASTVSVSPACDNATDDTAVIQAALTTAAQQVNIVKAGTCLISATLKIGSNQKLSLSQGTTIKLKTGSQVYMLENLDMSGGNSGIAIEGGTWDQNGTNNAPNGTTYMGHSIWLQKCNQCSIRNASFINATKFCILVSTADDLIVENIYFNTLSDGVHGNGPWNRFIIRNLRGHNADNMVGLTGGEAGGAYAAYATTDGPFLDGLIENLEGSANPAGLVRLVGTTATSFGRIVIRNIGGTLATTASACVELVNDALGPLVGAPMYGLLVDGVTCVPTSGAGGAEVVINASGLKDALIRGVIVSGDVYGVKAASSGTALAVDRLRVEGVYHSGTFTQPLVSIDGGAYGDVQLSGIQSYNTSNAGTFGVIQVGSAATVATMSVSDLVTRWPNVTNGNSFRIDGPITNLRVRGLYQYLGLYTMLLNGVVTNLALADVQSVFTGTTSFTFRCSGGGGFTRGLLSNVYQEGGEALLWTAIVTPQTYLQMQNIRTKGVSQMLELYGPLDGTATNVEAEDTTYLALLNHANAVGSLSVYGYKRLGTGTALHYINAGTWRTTVGSFNTSGVWTVATLP